MRRDKPGIQVGSVDFALAMTGGAIATTSPSSAGTAVLAEASTGPVTELDPFVERFGTLAGPPPVILTFAFFFLCCKRAWMRSAFFSSTPR